MKKLMLVVVIALTTTISFAETIRLKSGKIIDGNISEKTDDFIKVDVGIGVDTTYYLDEINSIDSVKITERKDEPIEGEIIGDENFDSLMEKAKYYSDEGDDLGSIEYLKKAHKLNPSDFLVNYILGTKLYQKQELQEALIYLENALEINPNHVGSYISVGVGRRKLEDYEGALEVLLKGHELHPTNFLICQELTELYDMGFHELDKALEFAQKCSKLDPEDGGPYLTMGSVYFQKHDYKNSKKYLIMAVENFRKQGNPYGLKTAQGLLEKM